MVSGSGGIGVGGRLHVVERIEVGAIPGLGALITSTGISSDNLTSLSTASFENPPTWTNGSGALNYAVQDTTLPLTNVLNVSGIPPWVRRITIQIFNMTQGTTTSRPRMQVGTSSLFTTGVTGAIWGNNGADQIQYTSGLIYLWNSAWTTGRNISGTISFTRMSSTAPNPMRYIINASFSDNDSTNALVAVASGSVTTPSSDPIQQFSIFTGSGAVNFTGGRYCVIYE